MIIPVTCAIIQRDGQILATQRSESMSLPLKWEFPGGKIEEGESPEECLHREIAEELGVKIKILERLPDVSHDYKGKVIQLMPFRCEIVSGEIVLTEHAAFRWCDRDGLARLDFAEADLGVLEMV